MDVKVILPSESGGPTVLDVSVIMTPAVVSDRVDNAAKRKVNEETDKMTPAETGEVAPNVYAVRDGYVNLFVMDAGEGYVAFDAGHSPDAVLEGLASLSIRPDQVRAVFLTHSDRDHTGGLEVFPAATVYLPELEEQMIDGWTNRFFVFGNKLERDHTLVRDNQVISIGGLEIEAIATPGHTPGSMCYLANGTHLFVGDTAGLMDGMVVRFNDFFNMNSETQGGSLRKLAALTTPTNIFTAHFGVSDNLQAAFGEFRTREF